MTEATHFLDDLISRYHVLTPCRDDILDTVNLIVRAIEADRKLMICGNGGSAADAEHIAGEMLKRFLLPRPIPPDIADKLRRQDATEGDYLANHLEAALPALALTGHPALATAMANDVAGDLAFAQQVYGLGQKGDVLLGISTSGRSRSVCHALRVAAAKGIVTVGLTGRDGGAMVSLCDVAIRVPETETYRIQELHLPVYHCLCLMVEAHFFGTA